MENGGDIAITDEMIRPRVLVVDDEHAIADTLAIILTKNGYDAATAYDGQGAVQKARDWKPDLLLSDIMMPGITGIEAAIQITALIPTCKVLLFSGQAQTADLLNAARQGGHHFEILGKPVHPADLLARLRAL